MSERRGVGGIPDKDSCSPLNKHGSSDHCMPSIMPGPEDTARSTREAILALIWLTVEETYSKQLITQLVSIMMKTTVKEKRRCPKRAWEEGQT